MDRVGLVGLLWGLNSRNPTEVLSVALSSNSEKRGQKRIWTWNITTFTLICFPFFVPDVLSFIVATESWVLRGKDHSWSTWMPDWCRRGRHVFECWPVFPEDNEKIKLKSWIVYRLCSSSVSGNLYSLKGYDVIDFKPSLLWNPEVLQVEIV